jgi:hypothetical protein
MKAVQFPAQLQKIATRVDGSINISIETQELSRMDMAELFSYRNALGYITFTPNLETKIEVPDEQVGDMNKSPAQRLRNVLYVMWGQSGKKKFDTFQQFYDVNMERLINQLKDRLDADQP